MDEIVITKLALKENDENNCSNVVTGLFDETSDPNNLFHVYPNPFHRNFNIEFSKKKVGSYKLLIMDMSGRAVFTTENSTKCKKKLDVAVSLSPGVYFMKLTIKDQIYYKRIVSN